MNRYIKYAIAMAISAWTAEKVMDFLDGNKKR